MLRWIHGNSLKDHKVTRIEEIRKRAKVKPDCSSCYQSATQLVWTHGDNTPFDYLNDG